MGVSSILSAFFDRTLLVERRVLSQNAVGSPVETWATLIPALKATVQPISTREFKELGELPQGAEYPVTNKAYCEYQTEDLKNGDRVTDSLEGKVYFIVSIRRYKSARGSITTGQHTKIFLSQKQSEKS